VSKAVLMKVKGIVNLNGKKASAGTFIQDGDTLTTGPSSFAGFMFMDTKSVMKVLADQTWYNASIEEINDQMDNNSDGGTMGSSTSGGSNSQSKSKGEPFVMQQFTGVAGVKG
jgi:hypothetical protein